MRLFQKLFWSVVLLLFCVQPLLAADAVRWASNLAAAQKRASRENRSVLIHFWSPACSPCRRLDRNVFSQAGVARALETQFVPVKINVAKHPEIARRFGIHSIPADVLTTAKGVPIRTLSCPGKPASYIAQLSKVASQLRSTSPRSQLASGRNLRSNIDPRVPPIDRRANRLGTDARTASQNRSSASHRSAQPRRQLTEIRREGTYQAKAVPADRSQLAKNDLSVDLGTATAPRSATSNIARNTAARTPTPNIPRHDRRELLSRNTGRQPAGTPHATRDFRSPARQATGQCRESWVAASNQWNRNPNPRTSAAAEATRRNPPASQSPARRSTSFQPAPNHPAPGRRTATPSRQYPPSARTASPAMPPPTRRPVQPPRRPANPPLAMDGCCMVTLIDKRKKVKGNPKYGAIHRGRTYLFVGYKEQQRFLATPDAYTPVLSGNDPMLFLEQGKLVPGSSQHGIFFGRQVYLFSSEKTLQKFEDAPYQYVDAIYRAMQPAPRGNLRR